MLFADCMRMQHLDSSLAYEITIHEAMLAWPFSSSQMRIARLFQALARRCEPKLEAQTAAAHESARLQSMRHPVSSPQTCQSLYLALQGAQLTCVRGYGIAAQLNADLAFLPSLTICPAGERAACVGGRPRPAVPGCEAARPSHGCCPCCSKWICC